MIVGCDAGIEASSGKLRASKHGDGIAMHGFESEDDGSQFLGSISILRSGLIRGRQEGKEERQDQRLQLSRTHGFIGKPSLGGMNALLQVLYDACSYSADN